jgi:hypothetical protein
MSNPNQPTQITMPQDFYDGFNRAITQSEGMPLEELATERPADAYKLLTRIAEGLAQTQTAESAKTQGIEATKKMDGEAALAGLAKHAVRETVQDTDIEPVDVIVSVFQKPRFRDVIRGRKTEPKQILAFRVEPPSLAF